MLINWAPWFGLHIPGLNLLQVTFLSRDIQKGHESSGSWVEGQELPKKVEYELGGERQIKKVSRKGEGRDISRRVHSRANPGPQKHTVLE